jgi:hypothetical protein
MIDERLLVFGSTFRVMQADRRLADAGLRHGLSQTPRGVTSPCGLCLCVPAAELPAALGVLGADLQPQVWARDAARWVVQAV